MTSMLSRGEIALLNHITLIRFEDYNFVGIIVF